MQRSDRSALSMHPSPEKLSKEDALSPSSKTPLIQGNLTMWRRGVPGEVLGERRFFRLWDRCVCYDMSGLDAVFLISFIAGSLCTMSAMLCRSVAPGWFGLYLAASLPVLLYNLTVCPVQERLRDRGPFSGNLRKQSTHACFVLAKFVSS